jgi:arabinose-5-phosphate isomerase
MGGDTAPMSTITEQAIDVLRIEAEGILRLTRRVGAGFEDLVELICTSGGRVIVAGIGKSGIVGRKIVATLNSTGTRAVFLHPVEAVHGDLGIVCPDDVFLALSNSGETDELNILLPSIRRLGCKIVAFTGSPDSTLARNSDIVVDVGVDKEACPLGLAPTASTTAQLAMGDALAVVLINKKHFRSDDFRKNHPGGHLGQRLSDRVENLMLTGSQVPRVSSGATMAAAVRTMDRHGIGVTLITDADRVLKGILTDGDIRRCVARGQPLEELGVEDVMTREPRRLPIGVPVYEALNLMEQYQITVLPIVDDGGRVQGVLHLHDILGKGEFKFNGS